MRCVQIHRNTYSHVRSAALFSPQLEFIVLSKPALAFQVCSTLNTTEMWTNHRQVTVCFFLRCLSARKCYTDGLLTPQFSIEEMQNGKVKKKK